MADEDLDTKKERVKRAIEQLNGTIPYKPQEELDKIELLPEYYIKGRGYLFCFSSAKRKFQKVCRGQKAFLIDELPNKPDKYLMYTWDGFLVEVDISELTETGFD